MLVGGRLFPGVWDQIEGMNDTHFLSLLSCPAVRADWNQMVLAYYELLNRDYS